MLPPRAAGSRRRPEAGARALDHGGAARTGSREIASLSARLTRGHSAAATINAKRRQFYYRCHRKRAGSGASVKRSLTAEKQYHQPTRGSWSGLQAVRGSEACIPEMQDCGAPDRSRLRRNERANDHARAGRSCSVRRIHSPRTAVGRRRPRTVRLGRENPRFPSETFAASAACFCRLAARRASRAGSRPGSDSMPGAFVGASHPDKEPQQS